jgi:hypothetical protein
MASKDSVRRLILFVVTAALGGCASMLAPEPALGRELFLGVDATVEWLEIEGGFWAVRIADGRLLDPHASLPSEFRVDGRPVFVRGVVDSDAVCVHGAGAIVELTTTRQR